MSETAGGKNRRKRKSRVPTGEDLVMGELSRRGFEAQLSDRKEHVLLVRAGDSAPKAVQVKTGRGGMSARFFAARNRDLAARFGRSSTSNPIVLIDAKSVEQYEDNWEILK
jgi:hypothetical protein